jgi:prepilin-type N-terminal cleavage/methylation domain-containing protein
VRRSGFTLLELAIVAAVVLLLAGIVVPQFQTALAEAQTDGTRQMLERVRTAIEYYAFQHDGDLPGEDANGWSAQAFVDQLTLASDLGGATADPGTPGYPFGPYLTDDIGANPFNELDSLTLIPPGYTMADPDGMSGWVYFAETGAFRANSACAGSTGEPVWDL